MSKADGLFKLYEWGFRVAPFFVLRAGENFEPIKSQLDKNKCYAVRSSANIEDGEKYSFAGIFETYLNVPYLYLSEYILKCCNYVENEKLRAYLKYHDISFDTVKMDVLFQEMVCCEKAGVAFSQNPITCADEMYIQVVIGLGEYCVSGDEGDKIRANENGVINYETVFQEKMTVCIEGGWVATVKTGILDQSRKKLSAMELSEIIKTIKSLTKFSSNPFEIEFGFCAGLLYLFQIRPITGSKDA